MSDLSWVDEATDSAFKSGKKSSKGSSPETQFAETESWAKLRKTYQHKITTRPEELALEKVAGSAFALGRRFPKCKGWEELFADKGPDWPSRQKVYRRLRKKEQKVNLLLEANWPGLPNMRGSCPVCEKPAKCGDSPGDGTLVECAHCGPYNIGGTTLVLLENETLEIPDRERFRDLVEKKKGDSGEYPWITEDDLRSIAP